jgi:hypothetical protein
MILFSALLMSTWASRHFHENFAVPLLEVQYLSGEPALQMFSTEPGQRIPDKVHLKHSWCRCGVARKYHAVPNTVNLVNSREPPATLNGIYRHRGWTNPRAGENMPRCYNQEMGPDGSHRPHPVLCMKRCFCYFCLFMLL